MNKFEHQSIKLRKSIIAYIEDYLKKENRSIIVEKGNLSYLAWDEVFPAGDIDAIQCVPEVEISMITLTLEKELRFIDSRGSEVMPGAFDTEELLYVVEYLEYLDEKNAAPVDEQ